MSEKKSESKLRNNRRQVLGRGLRSLLEPSFGDSKDKVGEFQFFDKKEVKEGKDSRDFLNPYAGNSKDFVQVKVVGIEQLRPNENQPRRAFDEKSLDELARSISKKGILQPILVREVREREQGNSLNQAESSSTTLSEVFEIIAGERRWRAAQKAGLHEIPVILKKASDQKSLEIALVENIQRKNLNSLEEAKAYDYLLKNYPLTLESLSQYLGKDAITIRNILRLLKLTDKSKEALSEDRISLGIAKVLLGIKDKMNQNTLLEHTIQKQLTVREVTHQVHWFLKKGYFKFKKKDRKELEGGVGNEEEDAFLEKLSGDLQKALGTRVQLHYKNGKGKVIFHFYSDEELAGIVDHVIRGSRAGV